MDFITGILGLAVLSGPLWLIVLAVPVSLFVAYKVAKGRGSIVSRIGVFAAVLLAVFMALFGDEIAGRVYLNHLCDTKAGVKVYQTVELPAEYWDEQGVSRIYRNFDSLLGKTYSVEYMSGAYSSLFHIDNAGYKYSNKLTGGMLGEAIDFRYWGGWIRRNLNPGGPSATRCMDYSDPTSRLIDRVFIREVSESK